MSLVPPLIQLFLTIFSISDYIGPKRRLLSEKTTKEVVPFRDHTVHYRNGSHLGKKGYWYMASKEWEAALIQSPEDPNYHHAVGLAYAELGRFDDARKSMNKALALSNNNPRVQQSLALLDVKIEAAKEAQGS
ncbi:MAG: tetratricopeptide repeat protein [Chloroflexaceae bacterium]|nr:tetratricopeptide repeat protein [Chloroflexaceae bacterium]